MKRPIFFVPIFIFILVGLFVPSGYNFQFGFGTKGFIKKTLEKGQQEGKIPTTKEEKEKGKTQISYSGKIDKFDLSQARYLFVSAKTSSELSPVIAKSPAIYRDISLGTTQQVIFKIKEDGNIEEVKITDEQGNIADVNVHYIIKMGTAYISVGLEVRGIWIVKTSTEGETSTEYLPTFSYNKYLVRLEDGAAWTGDVLPNQYTKKIEYDDYGNFYFVSNIYSGEINIYNGLIKLNTTDMSWQIISAQGDQIYLIDSIPQFWVDKFGNCLYYYTNGPQWGWKYRKITSAGTLSSTINEIPFDLGDFVFIDSNRDKIFYIKSFEQFYTSTWLKGATVGYIECNEETNYEIQHTSFTNFNVDPDKIWKYSNMKYILSTGDRKVSLMSIYNDHFVFSEIELNNGTTNYYYEIPFSSFGATQSNNLLSYQIISSTQVYVLFRTPQGLGYKYSFYAIYPLEQRYETIYETTQYAMQISFYEGFLVDVDGSITVYATDLQNEGVKVLLKIIPGDPPQEEILQSGTSEIYYLTRVR